MAERGDKRLCGGDSSKIRQRPIASYFSLGLRERKKKKKKKKIFAIKAKRNVFERRIISFPRSPSRLELTLDYCHATRHARWRKGGVIDTRQGGKEGSSREGKKPSEEWNRVRGRKKKK